MSRKMGSIPFLIDDDTPPPGPSSQKSHRSDPPFKSGASEPVPEHIMKEYEAQYPSKRIRPTYDDDETYGSRGNLDGTFEARSESTHTYNGDNEKEEDDGMRESPGGRAVANLLDDEYRKMMKDIQQLQELQSIGIESKDLPLPKICVVGGQSAGKSSVIEAMSGIKVPRSTGCCTRCPLEINLRKSNPNAGWSCNVSLVTKYMHMKPGIPSRPNKNLNPSGLGPWMWIEKQDQPFPFCTLTNKGDVPTALGCAQIAILNPSTKHERYIPLPGQIAIPPEDLEVKFSPNIVRLDISAPDLENLSFYDLPGVITVPEKPEEDYLVRVIQHLVREYIRDQTCIILLTHPITDDVANCHAMALVGEVQNALSRTRGVFTKADRKEPKDVLPWLRTFDSGDYRLGLGYSIVMNDPDTDLEHGVARDREKDFFANKDPWATLTKYKDLFGIAKLQASLSKLLYDQFRAYLPQIIHKIDAKIHEFNAELHELPEPPNNDEIMRVLENLFHLKNELKIQFDGGSHLHSFQKKYRELAQCFQRRLVQTRPSLMSLSSAEYGKLHNLQQQQQSYGAQPGTPQPGLINLDSDNEGRQSGTGGRRKFAAAFPSSSPAPPTNDNSPVRQRNDAADNHRLLMKTFTLDEIREINSDAQGVGILTGYAEKAIERMNQRSVQHWETLMKEFLRATERHLKRMVLAEFDKVFADKYRRTPLYTQGRDVINKYLGAAVEEQRKFAARTLRIEKLRPFTMNDAELKQGKQRALSKLQENRLEKRKGLHIDLDSLRHRRPTLIDEERDRAIKKVSLAEIGPDEFVNEIETMAVVRAYYDIAAARFVDNICQAFQAELFLSCKTQLKDELMTKLGIKENAQDAIFRLLAVDPKIEERRLYITTQKQRFEEARALLANRGGPERDNSTFREEEDVDMDGNI